MDALIRFATLLALVSILVSLARAGAPLPAWSGGTALVVLVVLLLVSARLARDLVTFIGAGVVIYMLWRFGGGPFAFGSIAVLALIMLALALMFRPFMRGRY
jgi:hypothetical protein